MVKQLRERINPETGEPFKKPIILKPRDCDRLGGHYYARGSRYCQACGYIDWPPTDAGPS